MRKLISASIIILCSAPGANAQSSALEDKSPEYTVGYVDGFSEGYDFGKAGAFGTELLKCLEERDEADRMAIKCHMELDHPSEDVLDCISEAKYLVFQNVEQLIFQKLSECEKLAN